MAIGCFTLGMSFEDVVYHCKAETSHQFSVELLMMVSHTVAQAMEIVKQMPCLFISQFYYRVLIQRNTAPDTVIVGWQKVLQKLIVGSKPLHLHIVMCSKITYTIGYRYYYKVVLHYVITTLIKHKATLTCKA